MKTWAEATKGSERRALLAWAESSGNITQAARALGITRRYLTLLLRESRVLSENGGSATPSENTVLSENTTLTHPTDSAQHSENPTLSRSLTYGDAGPNLGGMGSAVASISSKGESPSDTDPTPSKGRSVFLPNVPKDIKDWLEAEALRRKQAGLTRHTNMTLVVVEAIRALMEKDSK